MNCLFDKSGEPRDIHSLYSNIQPSTAPPNRPYIALNMVMSLDGKITLGGLGDSSKGLGSSIDQMLMHRLQRQADGVIIGASTLRAGKIAYPPSLARAVVTGSGDLPLHSSFFTNVQRPALVFTPKNLPLPQQQAIQAVAELHLLGENRVDLGQAVRIMTEQRGVKLLLCEGGGGMNFEMFRAELIDEMFLTLAPWVKGGEHIRTPVEGEGFDRETARHMELVSVYQHENELFLRYRRLSG
ncbi:MAG: RibD family protein [Armatimonadota bacterium]